MQVTDLSPITTRSSEFKTDSKTINPLSMQTDTQNKSVLYSDTPLKNANLLHFGKDIIKHKQARVSEETRQRKIESSDVDVNKISQDEDTQNVLEKLITVINDTQSINPYECAYGYQNLDKNDKETYKRLIELVESGKVSIYSLRGWNEASFDENYAKSVNKYYEALKKGLSDDEIMDLFIPCAESVEDGLNKVDKGEVFEADKKLYYKTVDSKAEEINLCKSTFFDIFNPIEPICQGFASDCYFLVPLMSMLDEPDARNKIYRLFNEHDGKIEVKLPNSNTSIIADKDCIFPDDKSNLKEHYSKGLKAAQLLSLAFEKELTYKKSKSAIKLVEEYLDCYQAQLAQSDIDYLNGILNNLKENMTNPDYVVYDCDSHGITHEELSSKGFPNPIIGYRDDTMVLYDFKEIQKADFKKIETFAQNQGIFYRANGGYCFDSYRMLGQDVYDEKIHKPNKYGAPLNDPWALYTIKPHEDEETNKYFINSISTKRPPDGISERTPFDFDKGIEYSHVYTLKPKRTPEGKVQYTLKNPYNSARKITIESDEEIKKYFKMIYSMYRKS